MRKFEKKEPDVFSNGKETEESSWREAQKEKELLLEEYNDPETPKERREEAVEGIKEFSGQQERAREALEQEIRKFSEKGVNPRKMIGEQKFKDWEEVCGRLEDGYSGASLYVEKVGLLGGMINFKLEMGVIKGLAKNLRNWAESGRVIMLSKKHSAERENQWIEFNKKVGEKRKAMEGLVEKEM